jgi:hypothetical protein
MSEKWQASGRTGPFGCGRDKCDKRERIMALTLRPIAGSPGDQHVMHGEWRVGQIEKQVPRIGLAPRWTWSLTGVPSGKPQGMSLAGVTGSLDEATAEVKKTFEQWLAWAQLSDAGNRL